MIGEKWQIKFGSSELRHLKSNAVLSSPMNGEKLKDVKRMPISDFMSELG
jgi:hypothetical protein